MQGVLTKHSLRRQSMKSRNSLLKALAAVMAASMILTVAGCGGGGNSSTAGSSTSSKTESSAAESTDGGDASSEVTGSSGPDDTTEHYEFDAYYSYQGSVKPWGEDAASKYMNEKFNITVNYSCPEADADSRLNLMISSDDLPDVIILDRNANWQKLISLGKLVDINTLRYEGCSFDEDILESSQKLLSVNGGLYGIPNWARKGATGGNASWMVNHDVYEQLGSPELKTLEDLHQFMLDAKDKGVKTSDGQSIFPWLPRQDDNGFNTVSAIYRSYGNPNLVDTYWSQADNDIKLAVFDDNYVSALKIANQWFREGLFPETIYTDSNDQYVEKLSNGRGAVLYYDFSQDDTNHFRTLLQEKDGNTYDLLGWELKDSPIFPPAEGVDWVYGEENGTPGSNVNCITTKAENPQRIFDLYSWMLTKDGSINMMYGPEGGLWEGKDEEGNPILKKPEEELSSDEKNAAGCWFWAQPAHADNVDLTKYAVNDAQPEASRSWVISIQAHVFTPEDSIHPAVPGQKFLTDENANLSLEIDPNDDLGMARQAITDECKMRIPQIIMASDDATFDKLVQDLKDFAESNQVHDIEKIYTDKRASNIELQGYTVCPGGAQHIMVAKGIAQVYTGTLYNPGTLIFSGFAWKCSGCGMMLGTEGSPLRSGVIGRYAINNCSYTDTMALFYGGVTGTFYGNIKTDSFWKHFAFTL